MTQEIKHHYIHRLIVENIMSYLPEVLQTAFRTRKIHGENGSEFALDGNIYEAEADLLYEVVQVLNPQNSIEIGLAQGASALAILQALERNGSGVHHIIDPFQKKFHNTGLAAIKKAHLNHRMKFYEDFPEIVIPNLPQCDFVFIDGSHLFDHTMLDFTLCNKKLKVGGVMAFHDLHMKAISKLVTYILRNHEYSVLRTLFDKHIYQSKFKKDFLSSPVGKKGQPGFLKMLYFEAMKPLRFYGIGNMIFLRKEGSRGETYNQLFDF